MNELVQTLENKDQEIARLRNQMDDMCESHTKAVAAYTGTIAELTSRTRGTLYDTLHIVFASAEHPNGPGFVEVENAAGQSIKVGEWIQRSAGDHLYNVLVIPGNTSARRQIIEDCKLAIGRYQEPLVYRENNREGFVMWACNALNAMLTKMDKPDAEPVEVAAEKA